RRRCTTAASLPPGCTPAGEPSPPDRALPAFARSRPSSTRARRPAPDAPLRARRRAAQRRRAAAAADSCAAPASPDTGKSVAAAPPAGGTPRRSEEHTSELQSRENLVCRLLLEKKK